MVPLWWPISLSPQCTAMWATVALIVDSSLKLAWSPKLAAVGHWLQAKAGRSTSEVGRELLVLQGWESGLGWNRRGWIPIAMAQTDSNGTNYPLFQIWHVFWLSLDLHQWNRWHRSEETDCRPRVYGRLMKKDFYLSRAIHLVILPDHKCFQDVCCPWYYSCELAVG